MRRIYQNRRINLKAFIPAMAWGTIILILSIVTGLNLPKIGEKIIATDKLAHAAAYLVLATALLYGFRRNNIAFFTAAGVSVLISAGYGVVMEILQYAFFPYRYFEVWDIVANIIGSIGSVLVSHFFIK